MYIIVVGIPLHTFIPVIDHHNSSRYNTVEAGLAGKKVIADVWYYKTHFV
jgi:hypothetical protein